MINNDLTPGAALAQQLNQIDTKAKKWTSEMCDILAKTGISIDNSPLLTLLLDYLKDTQSFSYEPDLQDAIYESQTKSPNYTVEHLDAIIRFISANFKNLPPEIYYSCFLSGFEKLDPKAEFGIILLKSIPGQENFSEIASYTTTKAPNHDNPLRWAIICLGHDGFYSLLRPDEEKMSKIAPVQTIIGNNKVASNPKVKITPPDIKLQKQITDLSDFIDEIKFDIELLNHELDKSKIEFYNKKIKQINILMKNIVLLREKFRYLKTNDEFNVFINEVNRFQDEVDKFNVMKSELQQFHVPFKDLKLNSRLNELANEYSQIKLPSENNTPEQNKKLQNDANKLKAEYESLEKKLKNLKLEKKETAELEAVHRASVKAEVKKEAEVEIERNTSY